jgi:hypothetical protein
MMLRFSSVVNKKFIAPVAFLDTSYSTWNVRSLRRSGSVTRVARELARNKLYTYLVGAHEVRWGKMDTVYNNL